MTQTPSAALSTQLSGRSGRSKEKTANGREDANKKDRVNQLSYLKEALQVFL
jgi:hypothetical protein